jgi:hypothetical protein
LEFCRLAWDSSANLPAGQPLRKMACVGAFVMADLTDRLPEPGDGGFDWGSVPFWMLPVAKEYAAMQAIDAELQRLGLPDADEIIVVRPAVRGQPATIGPADGTCGPQPPGCSGKPEGGGQADAKARMPGNAAKLLDAVWAAWDKQQPSEDPIPTLVAGKSVGLDTNPAYKASSWLNKNGYIETVLGADGGIIPKRRR